MMSPRLGWGTLSKEKGGELSRMQVQAVCNHNEAKQDTISCPFDGLTPADREEKRITTLTRLGLLDWSTVPVFDEATQIAARNLEMPICILGFMNRNNLTISSAVGLSRLGLMNQLAVSRTIPG